MKYKKQNKKKYKRKKSKIEGIEFNNPKVNFERIDLSNSSTSEEEIEVINKEEILEIFEKFYFTRIFMFYLWFIRWIWTIDNRHFINLIKLKNNYRHFLKEEFTFDNQKYILIGTINQSKIDHYTACIIKNINPYNNLELGQNYFYNDFVDNNKIKKINLEENKTICDLIIDYHPLILFYVKLKNYYF